MASSDRDEEQEHESWGVVQISRRSGFAGPLFGSSIRHCNTVSLTLCRASSRRHLNQEWIHAGRELIEVEMSAVQWAEAITNMNCGTGTPVTIRHVGGTRMPDCPDTNIRQKIEAEFDADMREMASKFTEATKRIQDIVQKKTALNTAERAEIATGLAHIHRMLTDHIPFMQSQFNEAIQDTVTQAKGEIEAFYTNAVMQAGKAALAVFGESPKVPALENNET